MSNWRLGGYFMDFTVARQFTAHHQIDIRQYTQSVDLENQYMPQRINTWLNETGRKHMKAAYISYPHPSSGLGQDSAPRYGVMMMTSFLKFNGGDPGPVREEDKDRAVREWLTEGCGGAEPEWISIVDDADIMRNGSEPRAIYCTVAAPPPEGHSYEEFVKNFEELRRNMREARAARENAGAGRVPRSQPDA